VFFGARDPASPEVQAVLARAGQGVQVGSCREAIAACDTVLLAIPWDQTRAVLEQVD
jgi:predicted dinucleotide-binding enzyme